MIITQNCMQNTLIFKTFLIKTEMPLYSCDEMMEVQPCHNKACSLYSTAVPAGLKFATLLINSLERDKEKQRVCRFMHGFCLCHTTHLQYSTRSDPAFSHY